MRALANDTVRWLIARFIGLLALAFATQERLHLVTYRRRQRALRRRFGIAAATPILGYGPEIERLVADRASRVKGAHFALTSGSSAAPKRLLYTAGRIRETKLVFVDAFARACRAFGLRRRSLFVLSALSEDASLTSQLLVERGGPSPIALLQAPYRSQSDPTIRQLVGEHGPTAVRVFLLTLSNPGILYATNPSTLATFLDEVAHDWPKASALVRRYRHEPGSLPAPVHRLVARLVSRGWRARLQEIADSSAALPTARWLPGLEAYLTWTGGYVAPFLERVQTHLPSPRFRLIPMYSMSTETVETVPTFIDREDIAFLPAGPGVLYEFLPLAEDDDDAIDEPGQLLPAWALSPCCLYTMVVSDAYGLRRYQTGDVFSCRRLVRGLPDLRFVRRRGLEHSFTGEKLTAQQASVAFERARATLHLPGGTHLALVPSWPTSEPVPHYRLVVIGSDPLPSADLDALARRCQAELEAQNDEYRSKVTSARLRPLRGTALSAESFARVVGGDRHRDSWEAQFKFLPLYRTRWDGSAA